MHTQNGNDGQLRRIPCPIDELCYSHPVDDGKITLRKLYKPSSFSLIADLTLSTHSTSGFSGVRSTRIEQSMVRGIDKNEEIKYRELRFRRRPQVGTYARVSLQRIRCVLGEHPRRGNTKLWRVLPLLLPPLGYRHVQRASFTSLNGVYLLIFLSYDERLIHTHRRLFH